MSKTLTLGSLFDGIGGWQIAAVNAGIKPIWSSEIDPFPMAVTKKWFPNTIQLGDITKLDGADIPPVDIICAGSPCFVAGTLITTDKGQIPIEDVRAGDKVMCDDGNWHYVHLRMINEPKPLYTIKAQGLLPFVATENHPIKVKSMEWVWDNDSRTRKRKFSAAEWVPIKDCTQKKYFIGFPIIKTEENPISITEEEAWLVGRYVADGFINNAARKDSNSSRHEVVYCIGKEKLQAFINKVQSYHVCKKEDRTVTKCVISSVRLMELCLECKKGAGNKEIPPYILNLPIPLLKAFIDGYMSGDGCFIEKNKTWSATTISKKLAITLQMAIHKVFKVPCKIYYNKVQEYTYIEGRKVHQNDTYIIRYKTEETKHRIAIYEDGTIWQPIQKISKAGYEVKEVYNIEVEGRQCYLANGAIVHNCQDLSVAGKRAGLEGERSGLFRKAISIVRGMRMSTGGGTT